MYFDKERKLQFIKSGCLLLDLAIGGGWPLGRISNVVGDKSSGKTGIAIEACANFNLQYPDGKIFYHETEAAFDFDYARQLGLPTNNIIFSGGNTVESLYDYLVEAIKECKDTKGLYIVDSLDALSDNAELERNIADGTYGGNKAKQLSQLFRRITKLVETSNIHLMVVSQVRDKIGVMFGEKHTRSGGRALDFYASQIVWLAETGKIKKVIKGNERIYGINVKAKIKKNKIGRPFRECQYPYIFEYGINDLVASLEFLKKCKKLEDLNIDSKNLFKTVDELFEAEDNEKIKLIETTVVETWEEIENGFTPKRKKYN